MGSMPSSTSPQIVCYQDGQVIHRLDELAQEEPLEIRVRGRAISVTMRTPGHDEELAGGFLLTEGIVRRREDILKVEHCGRNEEGNVVNVLLAPEVPVDFARLTRHVFASSSCGLCGKASIDAVRGHFPAIGPNGSDLRIDAAVLASLPGIMRQAQASFDRTGGLHAAAVFDARGTMIVLREDVGRHNAVDKVIGHCLRNGPAPLDRHVLLVSGRSSFEIMQKALAGRVPIVAAVSAQSSLAVQFAADSGQTLVGFLRGERMNVYAHPQRIRFDSAGATASAPSPTAEVHPSSHPNP
jgi:FdhD protein